MSSIPIIFGAIGIGVILTVYLELPYRREKKRQEEFEKKYRARIIDVIDEMPTGDTESIRHGHWESHAVSIKGVPTEACSICGEWSYGDYERYCPKCGAKMDEEIEER